MASCLLPRRDPTAFFWASDEARDDPKVVLEWLRGGAAHGDATPIVRALPFLYASDRLRADASFVLQALAVRQCPALCAFVDPAMLSDEDFVLGAIFMTNTPDVLRYTGPEFRGDVDFLLRAQRSAPGVFRYAWWRLRDSYSVALRAIAHDTDEFQFFSTRVRSDRPLLREIAERNAHALRHADPHRLDDDEFAAELVAIDAAAYAYLSTRLRDDEALAELAFASNGYALAQASFRICQMKEMVLLAVQSQGISLVYAAPALQDDEDVVAAALRENGRAMHYCSLRLREAAWVGLLAVETYSAAVALVGPVLGSSRDFYRRAICLEPNAALWTPRALMGDKSFVLSIITASPRTRMLMLDPCIGGLAHDEDVQFAQALHNAHTNLGPAVELRSFLVRVNTALWMQTEARLEAVANYCGTVLAEPDGSIVESVSSYALHTLNFIDAPYGPLRVAREVRLRHLLPGGVE